MEVPLTNTRLTFCKVISLTFLPLTIAIYFVQMPLVLLNHLPDIKIFSCLCKHLRPRIDRCLILIYSICYIGY